MVRSREGRCIAVGAGRGRADAHNKQSKSMQFEVSSNRIGTHPPPPHLDDRVRTDFSIVHESEKSSPTEKSSGNRLLDRSSLYIMGDHNGVAAVFSILHGGENSSPSRLLGPT